MKGNKVILIHKILGPDIVRGERVAEPVEERPDGDVDLAHGQRLAEARAAAAREGRQELFSLAQRFWVVVEPARGVELVRLREGGWVTVEEVVGH